MDGLNCVRFHGSTVRGVVMAVWPASSFMQSGNNRPEFAAMALSTMLLLSPNPVNDTFRGVDDRTTHSMQLFDSQPHGLGFSLSLGYERHRVLLSSNSVDNPFRRVDDGTPRSCVPSCVGHFTFAWLQPSARNLMSNSEDKSSRTGHRAALVRQAQVSSNCTCMCTKAF